MPLTNIPTVPEYTGVAPNRQTQAQNEFSANSDDSLAYQATHATNMNAATSAMNTLGGEVETLAGEAEASKYAAKVSEDSASLSATQAASDVSSANGNPLGNYANSLTFNSHNDYVSQNGLFRLKEDINTPYTTNTTLYPLATDDVNLAPWSNVSELGAIARSLNVPSNQIQYGKTGVVISSTCKYLYVPEQQKTYAVPANAQGKTIVSVVGDQIETSVSTYTMPRESTDAEYIKTTSPNGYHRTQQDVNYDNLNISDFGEIGGSNASPAINAMISELGYFVLPDGSFNCTDEILIPHHATTPGNPNDSVWRGQGMGKSVLVPVNMAGTSLIKPASINQYVRTSMRDFTIDGDVDSCIDITLNTTGFQLYQSEFRNLTLRAGVGSGFRANEHFSCSWYNVHASSRVNHAFDLQGGNSTILMNCYAHGVGQGKAGYRIKGGATMIGCNGIDEFASDCYWGWFGDLASNMAYRIKIIGGNSEDWNKASIALENFGSLSIENFTMLTRSSGTYLAAIVALNGTNHYLDLDDTTGVLTKGATRAGPADILSNGAMFLRKRSKNAGDAMSKFARTDQGNLIYSGVEEVVSGVAYATQGLSVSNIKAARDRSYRQPDVATIPANTSNFIGAGLNMVQTANTVSTQLNTITGGADGQPLTLLIKDGNTTIKNLFGGAGGFNLKSKADETPAIGSVYNFTWNINQWVQS